MTPLRVRAPATTANLGPGIDCAAAALDLWNELEVGRGEGIDVAGEGEDELSRDESHLGVRAFALIAPAGGRRFAFRNGIPLARGLGSSAATIALGLVAGTLALGRRVEPEALLALGLELEGHADNLGAALAGGACLTWEADGRHRIARVASSLPLVPIAVVPAARVETAAARAALPDDVRHADAAFTAARAALLGAGAAAGDAELFAAGLEDRLHEPYRAANAPLLGALRASLPEGAAGATLSGSGSTVVVWASQETAEACAEALRRRFPGERVSLHALSPPARGPCERTGRVRALRCLLAMRFQFVDCRWELGNPERGRELYLEGHIPGASFLDVEHELSAAPGAPPHHGGRHPLPDEGYFARSAANAGIGPNVFVVAYDQGATGGAARLWWLLRHFGHDDAAVLAGGIGAWLGPLRAGEEEIEHARFVPRPRRDDTVTADDLAARLGDERLAVVDARAPERYRGDVEPIDPVAGRIPCAVNVPYSEADAIPEDVLRAEEIVVYCGSGVTACVNVLALERAGRPDAKLYPGSWSDWSSRGLPAERG